VPQLELLNLYDAATAATDALFDRLASEDCTVVKQRPSGRTWSAEEYARHLVWVEDIVVRVECLGMEPSDFPEGFPLLPGQILERHFPLQDTREALARLHAEVRPALNDLTPEALSQTIEDTAGRTVAENLARYLELSAAARASAQLALRVVKS